MHGVRGCAAHTYTTHLTCMKLLRKSLLLFAALTGAALLLPGCGGSPDNKGDQFVSVSAFKSGTGFYIQGSPAIRIISMGQPQDVSPGNGSFNQIGKLSTEFDDFAYSGSTAEETWQDFAGDMADTTRGESSCLVNVRITNSSTNEYSIGGQASYTVSGNLGYMELNFDEVSGSNNNLEFAALIHFMGAVTRSDLTYDRGDRDSREDDSNVGDSGIDRVVITSLSGSTIKFWFNFETNVCLIELNYVGTYKYKRGDESFTSPPGMKGAWRITHPFLRLNN